MPISSQLQTLLTQFQSRYPMGCLCCDLLTIHQGQYVVRAVVQSGNFTVASAMASAPEVEAAEDQAKVRVLEALGFASETGSVLTKASLAASTTANALPSVPSTSPPIASKTPTTPMTAASMAITPEPLPHRLNQPETAKSKVETTSPSLSWSSDSTPELSSLEPSTATTATSLHSSSDDTLSVASGLDQFDFDTELPSVTNIRSASMPTSMPTSAIATEAKTTTEKPKATKSEKSSKRKAEAFEISPASVSVALNEPSDRSEEIMKIGIEMKRLGWSTEQGREYLKRTYGKRSRQELDDAELLDFLRYLEAQPLPMQTPF